MKMFRCLGIAMLFSVGCAATDDSPLSFEEFKLQAYHEPDTGMWVVNGDEAYETEAQLGYVYEQYLDSYNEAFRGIGRNAQELCVYNVNGQDIKWSAQQALNLTYCVSQSSFGSRYNTVVSALDSATSAWESAAGGRVNFIHDASQDGNCSKNNNNVVFNVRQVHTNQYLARSFFPNSSRSGREILVSTSSFGNISPWTLTGVFRHELGHTIGMRHEHTRPEAGTCFEDNNWRALTAYDSSSVMHYPQCNGTQKGDLVLTNLDKQGVSSLY
jgi:serine protease